MGYTHYYRVSKKYDSTLFSKVVEDFKTMLPVLDHLGVKLADGSGENNPIINNSEIIFNGPFKCGHTKRNLGVTWPSKNANGVSKNGVMTQLEELTNSKWFAGASLETRACDGDCSHETFSLLQKLDEQTIPEWKKDDLKKDGLMFEFTKTAYKPYDLAVNVVLIIASHYLKDQIIVASDGEIENWQEGMQLTNHFLGYGLDFTLDRDE